MQKARASGKKVKRCCFRAGNMDGWKKVLSAKMWNPSNIGSKKVKLKVEGQVLDNILRVFQGKKVAYCLHAGSPGLEPSTGRPVPA